MAAPNPATSLTAVAEGSGIRLTWVLPTDATRARHQVYRRSTAWAAGDGPGSATLVVNDAPGASGNVLDAPGNGTWFYKSFTTGAGGSSKFGFSWGCCIESLNADTAMWNQIPTIGPAWIRCDVPWSSCEPSPGNYQFGAFQTVVSKIVAAGAKPIAMLGYCPGWASSTGSDKAPPRNNAEYAAYCGKAAQILGPLGCHHYEIWNEPNIGFFAGSNPVTYANMMKAAYPAIHANDSQAVVISAGISPNGGFGDTSLQHPPRFLNSIYQTVGKNFHDAVGTHPYVFPSLPDLTPGNDNWGLMMANGRGTTDIRYMCGVMNLFGDAAKPMFATEYGYRDITPCNPCSGGVSVTETFAENALQVAYDAANGYSWVAAVCWYSYMDGGIGDGGHGLRQGSSGAANLDVNGAGIRIKKPWNRFKDRAALVGAAAETGLNGPTASSSVGGGGVVNPPVPSFTRDWDALAVATPLGTGFVVADDGECAAGHAAGIVDVAGTKYLELSCTAATSAVWGSKIVEDASPIDLASPRAIKVVMNHAGAGGSIVWITTAAGFTPPYGGPNWFRIFALGNPATWNAQKCIGGTVTTVTLTGTPPVPGQGVDQTLWIYLSATQIRILKDATELVALQSHGLGAGPMYLVREASTSTVALHKARYRTERCMRSTPASPSATAAMIGPPYTGVRYTAVAAPAEDQISGYTFFLDAVQQATGTALVQDGALPSPGTYTPSVSVSNASPF